MWIWNRTTTHLLDGKTPYEAFYDVKLDIGDIHLWGLRVWVCDLTAGKLDPRGQEGRFLGYNIKSKGCHIYWTNTCSIWVEQDLIFEDRPMTNELILLPEPSMAKDEPPVQTTTEDLKLLDTQSPKTNPNPRDQPDLAGSTASIPSEPVPDENCQGNSESPEQAKRLILYKGPSRRTCKISS